MISKQFLLLVIMFVCLQPLRSQDNDTINRDTIIRGNDQVIKSRLQKLLGKNKYLNSNSLPESLIMIERKRESKEVLFYAIFTLLFLFGFLKMFYSRYLNNLFRVFFNTSLRQSQLTDQLLQAKLPSLFFNIFYFLAGGFYIFLLLCYLGYLDMVKDLAVLIICIGALVIIYSVKYIVLKFAGWISSYKNAADTYIFIVFLINKIIAIALIPIIIIMAFSDQFLVKAVVIISWFIIFLMLLLRFLRSFGVLQNKLSVHRYHFFLIILGIEILPILLIYKTAMNLLTN